MVLLCQFPMFGNMYIYIYIYIYINYLISKAMKPCPSIGLLRRGTGVISIGTGTGTGVRYGCWVRVRVLGTGVGCRCWVWVRVLGIVGYSYGNWSWVYCCWVRVRVLGICLGAGTVPMYRTHVPCPCTVPSYTCTVFIYRTTVPIVPMYRTHEPYPPYPPYVPS